MFCTCVNALRVGSNPVRQNHPDEDGNADDNDVAGGMQVHVFEGGDPYSDQDADNDEENASQNGFRDGGQTGC